MLDFGEIVGQEAIKEHLTEAVKTGHVSHAYMLTGEALSGKRTLADAFALMLLCEKGGTVPCRSCHSCKQVLSGVHPDVIHVTHEKPASIGVDEVREQITDTVDIRPYSAKKKIYIVPDAGKMTVQAQNALLKTIEEPPDYAVLILLTENDEVLLETIRSRCVKLKIKPVEDAAIEDYLARNHIGDEADRRVISAFAKGNLGRAVMLSGSADFKTGFDENLKLLSALPDAGTEEILNDIARIREYNETIPDFLGFVRMWYRDILVIKTVKNPENLCFPGQSEKLRSLGLRLGPDVIGRILTETDRTEDRLKANVNPDLALEMLLLTIAERT